MRRLRHVYLILIGRVPYECSTERMELIMAMENLAALAAVVEAAADRLIAKAAADEASLVQAQADLAAADANAVALVQPIADKLNGAAPAA